MNQKSLGLASVIATGVGLIVATSCLLSIGQGASAIGTPFIISMAVACAFNILTALSICELNALMPNLTGGMAQFTLASLGPFATIIVNVGGFLCCQIILGSSEAAMFGNTLSEVFKSVPISGSVYTIALIVVLFILNMFGVDMFAKIQNIVAYGLIGSLVIMGILGCIKINPDSVVEQPLVISSDLKDIFSLLGLSFFLFIGVEFIVPISPEVRNARRNIPLGMVLSLVIILVMQVLVTFGFGLYTPWEELGESVVPHMLYGSALLGKAGTAWMTLVSLLAVISTLNTGMFGLSQLCFGMAKIDLLPKVFMRRNSKGVPYVGLFLVMFAQSLINATGLGTSEKIIFFINTGCVFWIFCYVVVHLNVIVLRFKLPKAPRTFKLPFGILIPVIGVIGNLFMIWNIAPDMQNRLIIFGIFGAATLVLAIYAFFWIKFRIKRKLFEPYPIKEVMAMDTDMYQIRHYPVLSKKLHLEAEPDVLPVGADVNTGTRPED
ncbi:MAG: APC family permease [Treponema sp.]|nr:APC family permease [Treponema sp.]MBQ2081668.1 APC family permease [Treponema sp.]